MRTLTNHREANSEAGFSTVSIFNIISDFKEANKKSIIV